MQKVSKQSLAMIALSILLAISIALTFTFAALAKTKTATGTIQFSGDKGIVYTGLASGEDNLTFKVAYDADGAYTLSEVNTAATDKTSFGDIAIKMADNSLKGTVTAEIKYYVGTEGTTEATGAVKTAIEKLISLDNTKITANTAAGAEVCKIVDVIKIKSTTDASLSTADFAALYDAAEQISKVVITFTVA